MCLIASHTAYAEKVIDQMQPQTRIDSVLSIDNYPSSEQKLAQTITASREGILKGFYLPISCLDGKLTIEVRSVESGLPGDTVLARKRIHATRITQGPEVFRWFPIAGELLVYPGQEIALVLANGSGSCGMAKGPEGNSYSGGEGFFDARPNAPGWVPFFSESSASDLAFIMVIKPL